MSKSRPLTWIERQDSEKAISGIEKALAEIPDFARDKDGWTMRRGHLDAMAGKLADQHGLEIDDNWNGVVVRANGIRATSTSGITGGLRNWCTAARKRLAQ